MGNEGSDAFGMLMARDWLNGLVDNMVQRKSMERLNSQIEAIRTPDYIQIFAGIDILADVLGEELEESDVMYEGYMEYHFTFRGVKVMQMSKERLGRHARAD